MNLVYNKNTGNIERILPDSQNYLTYFKYFPQEFIDSLATLQVDILMEDWKNYRVVDGVLTRKPDEEIKEIAEYGRLLTEEERLDILLQPSPEEVAKANSTIEILSMLQEVGLI